QRIDEIKTELETESKPLKEEINSLWQTIQDNMQDMYPELPELPEIEPEEDGWLFDSNRDYFE
ncbi:MAG TPA: hypothetical protein DD719_00110, partial [Desulfotomaculum sp.]|nr:hypothetical protein [Desulfotomaculum sp.]